MLRNVFGVIRVRVSNMFAWFGPIYLEVRVTFSAVQYSFLSYNLLNIMTAVGRSVPYMVSSRFKWRSGVVSKVAGVQRYNNFIYSGVCCP